MAKKLGLRVSGADFCCTPLWTSSLGDYLIAKRTSATVQAIYPMKRYALSAKWGLATSGIGGHPRHDPPLSQDATVIYL